MIQLAQYKVQLGDSHRFDDIIYHYQKHKGDKRPYEIHTELLFSDDMLFSSSGRGNKGLWPGVGTRYIRLDSLDKLKWNFYPLNVSDKDEIAIRDSCDVLLGYRYDWLGILGMGLPFAIQSPWAYFCSELCNHVLVVNNIANRKNPVIRPGQIVESYLNQGIIKV